jgi:hypothetical protein
VGYHKFKREKIVANKNKKLSINKNLQQKIKIVKNKIKKY